MYRIIASLSIVVGSIGVSAAALPNQETTCALPEDYEERYLTLSFAEFDQAPGHGWRPYYERQCYEIAAKLLRKYIEANPKLAKKHYMLPFHAGQMYAMDGQYRRAVAIMKKAYSDRPSRFVDWNAFVDANIAFLQSDIETLMEMRGRINQQPPMPDKPGIPEWAVGNKMNLEVVEGLVHCFGQAFDVAYSETCRDRARNRPIN